MRVGRLGHAGLIVSAGALHCVMDPVCTETFDGGANAFDPPIRVNTRRLRQWCNVLVLSHAHMDHFSPATLHLFNRTVPVVYPRGETLIERALDRLGFDTRVPAAFGDRIELEGLTLVPTPSNVSFPEMGMVFLAGGRVFWNVVDSVIDEGVIASVRRAIGRPDMLYAKYQPLIESDLRLNALGSEFPFERYGQLLYNVSLINPRFVAPAACGYRYARANWPNDRGFPITEEQFLSDLEHIAPGVHTLSIPHGGAVDVADDIDVDVDGVPFVRRLGRTLVPSFDWRPERGVPPLRDTNPRGHPTRMLRAVVNEFLDREFLGQLAACDEVWLDRMSRLRVAWRLEVVFPRGEPDVRAIDFTAPPLRWMPRGEDPFMKMHTSITASAIVGLLRGECSTYAVGFNDIRVMCRLYDVHRGGVTRRGGLDDEPLAKILYDGAEERYLDFELGTILDRA